MLKVFRDNLKYLAWVLWVVIAVFILFVFADFGRGVSPGQRVSTAAATVGSDTVSFREFERRYRELERLAQEQFGDRFNAELGRQLGLPQRALEDLVARKILVAEARRAGFTVSDVELRKEILQYPAFQDEQGRFIGDETYTRFLRSLRYDVGEFEHSVRNDLLVQKLGSALEATIFISDSDVEAAYRDQAERAKIRFMQLPSAGLIERAAISRQELETYFEARRNDYLLGEQRIVAYLLVDPDRMRSGLKVEEEELRAYYQDHPEEFTREEEVRARHILLFVNDERTLEAAEAELRTVRSRVAGGEDFAALATQLSEDEVSRQRGGDLGYFGRGRMNPVFEEAAFTAQPGEVVGPIRTELANRSAVHLIQVVDHRQGGVQSFEEARGRIQNQLLAERSRSVAESKAKALSARIRREELATDDQLRALAEQEGLSYQTTPPFAREDSVPGIGRATPFTETAFRLEVGEISEAISVFNRWAILALREIREPRLPELAEVEERVRSDLQRRQGQQRALARLEETRQQIAGGADFAAEAEALGLEVQESSEFGRGGFIQGLGSSPAVVDAALSLAAGELGGPIPVTQGAVLFEVLERKHFAEQELEEQKDQIRAALKQRKLNSLQASLIELRRQELEVHYDQQLLQSFGLLEEVQL